MLPSVISKALDFSGSRKTGATASLGLRCLENAEVWQRPGNEHTHPRGSGGPFGKHLRCNDATGNKFDYFSSFHELSKSHSHHKYFGTAFGQSANCATEFLLEDKMCDLRY